MDDADEGRMREEDAVAVNIATSNSRADALFGKDLLKPGFCQRCHILVAYFDHTSTSKDQRVAIQSRNLSLKLPNVCILLLLLNAKLAHLLSPKIAEQQHT